MAKHPAVFLDRDGTIIEDLGYIKDPSDIVFYPSSVKALSILQKHYLLFIITNQSGISKGLTTSDEVDKVNNSLVSRLKAKSVVIKDLFYCPHRSEDNCDCKKPKPYFIKKASEIYNLNLPDSFIIGDHPSDVLCGLNAGVKPIYVLTGHGTKHMNELANDIKICESILDAAQYIEKIRNRK
jgi:histidinol-phosphate phosphatase family protein